MTAIESRVDPKLAQELDASVDAAMESVQAEADSTAFNEVADEGTVEHSDATDGQTEEQEGTQAASTEDASASEDVASESSDDSESVAPDDSDATLPDQLLSRAVLAGLPLAEAREYPNADLLGKTVDRLEATGEKQDDSSDDTSATEADESVAATLDAIPDLDPEVYRDEIVDGFKAMKAVIARQEETIASLRGDQAVQGQGWFGEQVSGLADQVQAALKADPEKRTALRSKFDVLSAGYKAAEVENVDRASIFSEAVDLTLRTEVAAASDESKKDALGKRRGQHISRPGTRQSKPKGDVYEDTAAEIDRKFGTNN